MRTRAPKTFRVNMPTPRRSQRRHSALLTPWIDGLMGVCVTPGLYHLHVLIGNMTHLSMLYVVSFLKPNLYLAENLWVAASDGQQLVEAHVSVFYCDTPVKIQLRCTDLWDTLLGRPELICSFRTSVCSFSSTAATALSLIGRNEFNTVLTFHPWNCGATKVQCADNYRFRLVHSSSSNYHSSLKCQ